MVSYLMEITTSISAPYLELEGTLERNQGYDGKEYWLKANGKLVNDTLALKRVKFSRPTNF